MKRSPYDCSTRSERLTQWWADSIVCPLLGHRWSPKMYDYVCLRCRTSKPRTYDGMGRNV